MQSDSDVGSSLASAKTSARGKLKHFTFRPALFFPLTFAKLRLPSLLRASSENPQ